MKCSISLAMGVSPTSNPDAKDAIRPITVLSPHLITTPRAEPKKITKILIRPHAFESKVCVCVCALLVHAQSSIIKSEKIRFLRRAINNWFQ